MKEEEKKTLDTENGTSTTGPVADTSKSSQETIETAPSLYAAFSLLCNKERLKTGTSSQKKIVNGQRFLSQKTIGKKEGYIMARKEGIRQNIGITEVENRKSLFDQALEDQQLREQAIQSNITEIGTNWTISERATLQAILEIQQDKNQDSKYITFTQTELEVANGLNKNNKAGIKEMKKALKSLHTKKCIIHLQQENKDKNNRCNLLFKSGTVITELTEGYKNITKEDAEKIKQGEDVNIKGKSKIYEVTLNTTFSKGNYSLYPRGLFPKIKKLYGKISKYVYRFIDIIMDEANDKLFHNQKSFEYKKKTLITKLKLTKVRKYRQDEIIKDCHKKIIELGYIEAINESQGINVKYTYFFNSSAFPNYKKQIKNTEQK
jgi:hypothetical protein